jgi:hypothetical protein
MRPIETSNKFIWGETDQDQESAQQIFNLVGRIAQQFEKRQRENIEKWGEKLANDMVEFDRVNGGDE